MRDFMEWKVLEGWHVFPLPLDDVSLLEDSFAAANAGLRGPSPGTDGPVFYKGTLTVSSGVRGPTGQLPDTYLSVRGGWGKGLAFINGFNLGWYWPNVGPQGAQYIPGPLLCEGENEVLLLEVETAPADPSVIFTEEPDFAGPSAKRDNDGPQPSIRPFDNWPDVSLDALQRIRDAGPSLAIAAKAAS